MLRRKHVYIISVCIIFMFIVIVAFTVSALNKLDTTKQPRKADSKQVEANVENEIRLEVLKLSNEYKVRQAQYDEMAERFIKNVKKKNIDVDNETVMKDLWNRANQQVKNEQLFDSKDEHLGSIVSALKLGKIIKADVHTRGTQLKILLNLKVRFIS